MAVEWHEPSLPQPAPARTGSTLLGCGALIGVGVALVMGWNALQQRKHEGQPATKALPAPAAPAAVTEQPPPVVAPVDPPKLDVAPAIVKPPAAPPPPSPAEVAAALRSKIHAIDRDIEEQEAKYKRRVALGGSMGSMAKDIEEAKKIRERLKAELDAAESATISP
jgi:hypothetical protein